MRKRVYGCWNPMSKGAKAFRDNHWGISHGREIRTTTPDLDRHLTKHQPGHLSHPEITEWGRFVGFGFIPIEQMNPDGHGPEESVKLADPEIDHNYLAYDPHHPHQRLYFILSPGVRKEMKAAAKTLDFEKTFIGFHQKFVIGKLFFGKFSKYEKKIENVNNFSYNFQIFSILFCESILLR